jgi:hypothetical protein
LLAICLLATGSMFAQVRVVHVYVSLADNQHQGIVPVPSRLGNGDDPAANLYWGAAFGVKTFFRKSPDWELVAASQGPSLSILERCVFKNRREPVYLVADAYQGSRMRDAVKDFLSAAAGLNSASLHFHTESGDVSIAIGGGADLVAYVGHDAFMDFSIPAIVNAAPGRHPEAIILACASKAYFSSYLRSAGSVPLLWTSGLMAPEAYTLKAALDGWIAKEDAEHVRQLAAVAYDKYQHCGLRAAQRLFVTGW